MSTYQFIAGTDVACIGLWDRKWSDPSIREKSLSSFLKRLPTDAEQKRLFYINTGGDGQSSVEIHIDDQFVPDNRYRRISSDYAINIETGEAILDGLESYGSVYTAQNTFNLEKGTYSIDLYKLTNPETEESSISQIGQSRKPHIVERFVFLGVLILGISIFLFFQKKYLIASILFLISMTYSFLLGKIQEQERLKHPIKYKIDIKVPYLVFCLTQSLNNEQKGGHISLV